jgi:hypothetical protein
LDQVKDLEKFLPEQRAGYKPSIDVDLRPGVAPPSV